MIEIKNLSYSYNKRFNALNEINLKIKEGSLLCVIGENGCGKSTLLKTLDALIFSNSGEYVYKGVEINEKKFKDMDFLINFRTDVAYLFQNSESQLFCPTVFDEIAFSLRQLGFKESEILERVNKILKMFEIEKIKDRPPYSLSGGEKKKAALASVLITNPSLILLDEPTNDLDPKTQSAIFEMILGLKSSGKTVIIATHDIFMVKELNPEVFVMFGDHSGVFFNKFSDISLEILDRANLIYNHSHYHNSFIHSHIHTEAHEHKI
jgi:cobalt/nickel transport system ATP-binding protein